VTETKNSFRELQRDDDEEDDEESLPDLGDSDDSNDDHDVPEIGDDWKRVDRKKKRKPRNGLTEKLGGFCCTQRDCPEKGESFTKKSFQRVQEVAEKGGSFTKKSFQRIGRPRDLCGRPMEPDKELGEGDLMPIEIRGVEGKTSTIGLKFQVTDVNKPLVSVKRIVEKGNFVRVGPADRDDYIENGETKEKILLRPNGRGSYLMDVNFVGGEKTTITVDSGAEENVCPWDCSLLSSNEVHVHQIRTSPIRPQ
jgi:hypothetical protein